MPRKLWSSVDDTPPFSPSLPSIYGCEASLLRLVELVVEGVADQFFPAVAGLCVGGWCEAVVWLGYPLGEQLVWISFVGLRDRFAGMEPHVG